METSEKPKIPDITGKSKYELTLSEFPVFLLAKKGLKEIKVISYEDTIVGKGGELVKREWKVYPDAKHGFGTASTFETLYDLFQIWKDNGFEDQYINFGSIYNLVKRRGLTLNDKAYERIKKDLSCLVGIKIEAKRAFWDNDAKSYVTKIFHIFDEVNIYEDKRSGQGTFAFSRIKASDVLMGSVLANSLLVADFDRKFFFDLTPVEQRLALYLSKIFRSQAVNKRELLEFASQLPLYAREAKHTKEILKKACNGLLTKGFSLLASFDFERAPDKTQYIIFRRKGAPPKPSFPILPKPKQKDLLAPTAADPAEVEYLTQEILNFCEDKKSLNFYKKVAQNGMRYAFPPYAKISATSLQNHCINNNPIMQVTAIYTHLRI